jgi:3-methyladenine DNA glycosylase AlkD
VRRATVQWRREILKQFNLEFLVQVADKLFTGEINEEKHAAVFLLQNITAKLGDDKFVLLESWLTRVSTWADHDALVYYLIAPMVAAESARAKSVFRWAKSRDRWHRRAACVALICAARQKMFFPKLLNSRIGFFPMRTTWCGRVSGGYFAKLPRRRRPGQPII